MRMNTNREVTKIGTFKEENKYKVKNTPKMFKILSDGLYSDKILAVIREISCNAEDAHIAAGKADIPIEVSLPTTLHPEFVVKDYGIGLSHADVMELYTTYGESLKDKSNDFTGALGLGSKSPFAYSDSFIVESRFEGEIRQYTCFIDADGIPVITLLSCESTDECNGLTVKVPAMDSDFLDFRNKALQIYNWFSPRPNVKNWPRMDEEFTKGKLIRHINIPDYGFCYASVDKDEGGWSKFDSFCAKMGPIVYPIDISKLQGDEAKLLKEEFNYSTLTNIVLLFEMGEIDIAANREALSYDAKSSEIICRKLKNFRRKVKAKTLKILNKSDNEFEQRKLYLELIRKVPALKVILGDKDNRFKGQLSWTDGDLEKLDLRFGCRIFSITSTNSSNNLTGYRISESQSYNYHMNFKNLDGNIFVFWDTTSRTSFKEILKFNFGADYGVNIFFIETGLENFRKFLGNVPMKYIHKFSELKKPERLSRTALKTAAFFKVTTNYRYNSWGDSNINRFSRSYLSLEEGENLDNIKYLVVSQNKSLIKLFGAEISNLTVWTILNRLDLPEEIYFIFESNSRVVKDISIAEEATKYIEKHMLEEGIMCSQATSLRAWKSIKNHDGGDHYYSLRDNHSVTHNKLFKQAVIKITGKTPKQLDKIYLEILSLDSDEIKKDIHHLVDSTRSLYDAIEKRLKKLPTMKDFPVVDGDKLENELDRLCNVWYNTYPLLKYIGQDVPKELKKEIKQYIKTKESEITND